ncbi:MAG: PGF-pre-PGF domain-containing protein [Candidatus Woesearchaeota archaeon]
MRESSSNRKLITEELAGLFPFFLLCAPALEPYCTTGAGKMRKINALAWFVVFLLAFCVTAQEDVPYALVNDKYAPSGEDFTATGTARIATFACSPAEGQILVRNTGRILSAYDIVAEGKAKKWVAFEPKSFVLQPGQSQIVQEFFSIPCDAEDETLEVAIQTEELELVLTQDIIVQTPNNLVLIPIEYSREIMPCSSADFVFLLQNPAEFAETYLLKVTNSPEETVLSDKKILLEPHENETITITVSPKDCSLSGDFTPILQVATEKTRLLAEIEMYLHVNNPGIPVIAAGVDKIRALVEPQEAQLKLENTGDNPTSYSLFVEGADWITLQPQKIVVPARNTATIKLVMQPTETTTQTSYPVKIIAVVDKTGTEYTKELTVVLKNPTFVDKLFAEYLAYTVAAIVLLVVIIILVVWGVKRYNTPEAKARRAEKKAERERLRKQREAEREAKRKEREEEIKRREEQKEKEKKEKEKEEERRERELERERLKAQREYEKQLRRENLVISKDSVLPGFKATGKRFLKLLLVLIILAAVALGIVYNQTLSKNALHVLSGILILLIILVLHRIRRQRLCHRKWKLALANKPLHFETKWKKGLSEAAFKLNNVIEKLVVTARQSRPSVPPYADCVYQTFVISANVENEAVLQARIRFKVRKSWMQRHNVAPSSIRLLHLGADRWNSIVAEPVSTDHKYVYYTASAEGLGEFAIIGKPGKKAKKEKRMLANWVLPAIFVIVALIALVSLAIIVQVNRTPTIGIPPQVWKQDTQHTLDLSQYFKDPDGDPLTYSSGRTENIEIMFVGDKAVFTPRYGWHGTERVVFLADDGKGGLVKSNPVELVVEPDIIPTWWKRNAAKVLGYSIIVLVLLALILFRKQFKKMVGLE